MTYIERINLFWKTSRNVKFSPNEAFLYFFLLNECNARDWENPFVCPNRLIVLSIGISEPTLIDCRNRLQNKGLIKFESGKRNECSPKYYLNDLSKNPSKDFSKNLSKNLSKDTNILKNKTKDYKSKEISTNVDTKKADESTSFIAQKKTFDKSLSSCRESLLNDVYWSDAVCMNNRLTKEDFVFILNEFFKWLETSGETEKSERDAKKHFASWLIIQKEKNGKTRKTDATGRSSSGSQWASKENISKAVAVGYALANAGNKE